MKIRLRRYGYKDMVTKIRLRRYGYKDTVTKIRFEDTSMKIRFLTRKLFVSVNLSIVSDQQEMC